MQPLRPSLRRSPAERRNARRIRAPQEVLIASTRATTTRATTTNRATANRATANRPTTTRPATGSTARLVVAGGAVATLALVAGPAVAAPAGTAPAATLPAATVPAATTAAITTAVQTAPATAAVPPTEYVVTDIRTAATDGDWAGATLQPSSADLDPATVVLHRTADVWTVVDLGTAQVGCTSAPAAVVGDLGLRC